MGYSIVPEGTVDYVFISLEGDMYIVIKRPVVTTEDCWGRLLLLLYLQSPLCRVFKSTYL